MRGRTNITQRTGPTVIGNLVTQKQVTGSNISIGDFVEFTGTNSTYESLVGPYNFIRSCFFKISSTIYGLFSGNYSNQCKFIIFQNNVVLKEVTISDIPLGSGYTVTDVYYDSVAGKFYVCCSRNPSSTDPIIYVFNYNASNYNVTYDTNITLDVINNYDASNVSSAVTNHYSSASTTVFIRNGYIYVFVYEIDSKWNNTFHKLSFDGTTIIGTEVLGAGNIPLALYTTENYAFLFHRYSSGSAGGNTTRHGYVCDLTSATFTVVQTANIDFSYDGDIYEKDGYFYFAAYNVQRTKIQSSDTRTLYIHVFYVNANDEVVVTNYMSVGGSVDRYETYYPFVYAVQNESKYNIVVFYTYIYGAKTRFRYFLFTFNPSNTSLALLEYSTLNDVPFVDNSASYELGMYLLDNGTFSLFLTQNVNDGNFNKNYLNRTKFVIANNKINFAQGFDLVKKYENAINGVAKTGGSAGEQISVYIP